MALREGDDTQEFRQDIRNTLEEHGLQGRIGLVRKDLTPGPNEAVLETTYNDRTQTRQIIPVSEIGSLGEDEDIIITELDPTQPFDDGMFPLTPEKMGNCIVCLRNAHGHKSSNKMPPMPIEQPPMEITASSED